MASDVCDNTSGKHSCCSITTFESPFIPPRRESVPGHLYPGCSADDRGAPSSALGRVDPQLEP